MNYFQYPAHPLLLPIIQYYWFVEGSDTSVSKVIPDGCCELIFHFGDPYQIRQHSLLEQQPSAIAAGQLTRPIYLQPSGTSGVMGVKFKPAGLWKLFGCNMLLLQNQALSMDDVLGINTSMVCSELQSRATHFEKIKVVEKLLLSKLHQQRVTEIDFFIHRIGRAAGQVSMRELSAELKVSDRKMQRLFNEQIGVSAKQYARLVRFIHVFSLLQRNNISTAECTYLSGYFDQPHFNKEFKQFSGEDPGSYFSNNHEFSNFFMIDNR